MFDQGDKMHTKLNYISSESITILQLINFPTNELYEEEKQHSIAFFSPSKFPNLIGFHHLTNQS